MTLTGNVWKFGDDVNTDVIHAPAFFSLDPDTVKRGLFHGLDPQFHEKLAPGDVLVAGDNFGCGSSRETSIRSLLLNRVGAIVAVSFARIFFRNATNNGLPCLQLARAADVDRIRAAERVTIRAEDGVLVTADGAEVSLVPPGEFIRRIWQAGGLLGLLPAGGGRAP